MANREFKLEIGIAVSQREVREFLLDLENLAPLHPLIKSIELLDLFPERPTARRYRVVDQIPLGPFRIGAAYWAELEKISEDEVFARAWQRPGIKLETRYRLSPLDDSPLAEGGGTYLEEHVRIDAPFGLRRFIVSQASRAHAETLAKMKQLLEARASVAL